MDSGPDIRSVSGVSIPLLTRSDGTGNARKFAFRADASLTRRMDYDSDSQMTGLP